MCRRDICSICLESNPTVQLTCGHCFHGKCIVELIESTMKKYCENRYNGVDRVVFAKRIGLRCPNCRGKFNANRFDYPNGIEDRRWFVQNTSIVLVLAPLQNGFMLIVADHDSQEGCFINLSCYSEDLDFTETCNTLALNCR